MFSLSLSHALQDCGYPILRQYPNGFPYLKHTCDASYLSEQPSHQERPYDAFYQFVEQSHLYVSECDCACVCVYVYAACFLQMEGYKKTGHPLPPRARPAALSFQPQLETHSSPIVLCLCLFWIKDDPFNIQVHKEQLINHTHTCCERDRSAVYY